MRGGCVGVLDKNNIMHPIIILMKRCVVVYI